MLLQVALLEGGDGLRERDDGRLQPRLHETLHPRALLGLARRPEVLRRELGQRAAPGHQELVRRGGEEAAVDELRGPLHGADRGVAVRRAVLLQEEAVACRRGELEEA